MVKINEKSELQANNKLAADKSLKKKKKIKRNQFEKDKSADAQASTSALITNNLTTDTSVMKKKRKKKKKIKKTNVGNNESAPLATPTQPSSCVRILSGNKDSLQVKEKGRKNPKFSGFIFMCNGKTKPQCFQFQVFGLPIGQKEVVEKIKPGTKLFLFDVELKLLYGIYEATSEGKMNLEPTAFEGKFPAQVKFRILNGCLPLPERSFKKAIIENYNGVKFSPELSKMHVNLLMSLFRPLDACLSAASNVPVLNAAAPVTRIPPKREDQYKPPAGYLSRTPLPPAQRTMEQHHVQALQNFQHQKHAAALLVDRSRSAMELQNFPTPTEQYYTGHYQPSIQMLSVRHQELPHTALMDRASSKPSSQAHFDPYYDGRSHPTYSSDSHGLIAQERNPRHDAVLERYHQGMGPESEHHRLLQESGVRYQSLQPPTGTRVNALSGDNVSAYYSMPTAPYKSSTIQTAPVDAYYPHSAAPYVPTTITGTYSVPEDPYIPEDPYGPSSVSAYYSHPSVEPYVPSTAYHTDCTTSYVSPAVQPHAPASRRYGETLPTASYHSLARPTRIIR